MRLVDADALPIVKRGKNHHREYVFADITDAPTIAAIPVEWLQESRRNSMDAQWHYAVSIVIRKWLEEQEARNVRTQTAHD